jgi:CubicO group peptidase (beta-lactamase class C family)
VYAQQQSFHGSDSWSIVIIRHGWLVREYYTFNILWHTRFDIFSATKSFTSTAWGLLLDDSCQGKLPNGQQVDLDSPAYPFIPEGYPLSDPRKERITVRHLLSMTSGISDGAYGSAGMAFATGQGPFEYALGKGPNRFGDWVDKLVAEPGTEYLYSNSAFVHLSLAFANIMGREIDERRHEGACV